MSDTLEVFGTEYTGVEGFKATDDNGQTQRYVNANQYLPLTGGTLTGDLTITGGSITIDNHKFVRSKDTNDNIKTLIHLNAANNVIVNGDACGTTYIQAGDYISLGAPFANSPTIRNSSYAYKAQDSSGDAQTLLYLTSGNYIDIGSTSNTNVNGVAVKHNLTCDGTLTVSGGAITASSGAIIANNCTSYNGGVAGGYLSTSGRCALVSASSSAYPQVMFVTNKSTSAYTQLRATNTSGTYTVTLPASTGTLSISSSDIRLKENVKDTEVSGLDLINKIKLHQYDWKEEYTAGAPHWNVGMIADEIESLDENLTYGGGEFGDGTLNVKGIDTLYLIGYLIKAVQELSDKIKGDE